MERNTDFQINYYPAGSIPLLDLTYVIIGARENGKWIFVRNKDRNTWELPAGHIEENESAENAAERELFEETGIFNANFEALFDYSVSLNGTLKSGRLFYADVKERGNIPDSEIAEIHISEISPEPATYPEAHKSFLEVLERHIQ